MGSEVLGFQSFAVLSEVLRVYAGCRVNGSGLRDVALGFRVNPKP